MKSLFLIFKKYKIQFSIIILSSLFILISLFLLSIEPKNCQNNQASSSIDSNNEEENNEDIAVDVSGSVKKPDIYFVKQKSRISDLIKMAGGLSEDANKDFFYRNFNLSKFVKDQEKIYVPSITETEKNLIIEDQKKVDYTDLNNRNQNEENDNTISINNSEESDLLKAFTENEIKKIIKNRPYENIDELLTKKSISKTKFNKVKDIIDL